MAKTQDNYTLHYRLLGLTIQELKQVVKEIKGITGLKPIKVIGDESNEIKL